MIDADSVLANAPAMGRSLMVVDVWVDLFAAAAARNGALGTGLPVVLSVMARP